MSLRLEAILIIQFISYNSIFFQNVQKLLYPRKSCIWDILSIFRNFTYALHLEALNTLLVLMSIQMFQPQPAHKFTVYQIMMQGRWYVSSTPNDPQLFTCTSITCLSVTHIWICIRYIQCMNTYQQCMYIKHLLELYVHLSSLNVHG